MKRVLILKVLGSLNRSEHYDWSMMSEAVNKLPGNGIEAVDAAYSELIYEVGVNNTRIFHCKEGWDVGEFDLIIFNKVGLDIELAIATAHYLKAKNIPFIDDYLLMPGRGKLASSFLSWSAGLPIPWTIYASANILVDLFATDPPFDYPFILKADVGSKGKDNYLIKSLEELKNTLKDTDVRFVAQPFVQNDGDYRVLVMNGKVPLVIHRKGADGSHMNNTSQGGNAKLVDPESLDPAIIRDSLEAAKIEKLSVAGIDVLQDMITGKHYILEVNRAPQLYSGSFVDEKLDAYAKMIQGMLDRA
jgi:glutathione synthase/RimK-type ligase-like ATP-grasp enzyme